LFSCIVKEFGRKIEICFGVEEGYMNFNGVDCVTSYDPLYTIFNLRHLQV